MGKPAFRYPNPSGYQHRVLGDEEDLNCAEMRVGKVNWLKYEGLKKLEAVTKIRYKDRGALSQIVTDGHQVLVQFYEPVKGIAPGQSSVFYEGDDVVGGGIIQRSAL